MSAWIVYSKDGLTERCELHAVEYGGTHMGERAVTATFESNSKVDFDIFDYLSYRGEVFELESVPTVKKTSSFEYSYELRFVSRKYELERCEMRDLVPSDNGVVYPTPLSFSFTGDVRYLTDRIQACLDDLYGEGVWNIVIADGVESEEKNITIAQQNCWNALALVNSTYGLDFYIKGRVITIGGSQPVVSHVFEYGKGNGLYEIERAANTDTAIVTKLRAYGSDRNLDYSYPKKPEWSDSNLPVSFAFSPLRLMLPSFKVDKTDYVLADEETIKRYGIREASIVYEDIYPSITGATHNGQAIDEIKAVEAVDDNASTFVVHLHDLGFDLEAHLTTADAQISMKSGAMQGYTFTISNIEKQQDNSYKITLGRVSAEGGENYNIPNSDWNMREGDKFVLLNILMPQKYIREAENRLKQRAEEYLAQYSKTNFGYNIGLHDKFLIENPSVYNALIEGSKLSVYDEELNISEDVTIQSITITEDAADNTLPQVKVTLNNKPSASTLDRIQGKIDSLANESAANNFATQSEIMAQYRKKLDKPFFDKLFAAVDAKGNEIPSTDTVTPVAYIKARYDFAVVGGVTMYLNDGSLDLPTIFEGLPIDNDTIYWEEVKDEEGNVISKVLKSRGVGEGGVTPTLLGDLTNVGSWANAIATEDRIMVQKKDSSSWTSLSLSEIGGGSADFSNVLYSGNGNAFTSFSLSEDKKTLTFVKGQTFALQTELDKKWTTDNVKIANWNTAYGWGNHAQAGYFKSADFTKNKIKTTLGISDWALASTKPSYTTKEVAEDTNLYFTNARAVSALTETLEGYVTLSGTQSITGEKNFTGGLKVNGSPIVYNATGKYWKLEGDLLVTGGITMFGNDSSFSPSTITQAVNIDGSTLVRKNGVIMLNPDIDFGGGSDIDLSEYAKKATTLAGYGIADAYTKTEVDSKYLLKSSYTASDVLAKLKTVDGEGSGLVAETAIKLHTSRKLWGASFDGSADIKNTGIVLYQNASSSTGGWARAINSKDSSGAILSEIGFYGVGDNLTYTFIGGRWNTPRIAILADGKIGVGTTTPQYEFDVNGSTRIQGTSIVRSVRPELNNSYNLGDSSYLWANIYTKKANIDGIEIKKSANGVLYIGGNLVVSGGVTMYGTDGTTANTIWEDAPIANTNGKKGVASYDPNFFAVNNGEVTFIGSTGDGGVTDYNDLTNKPDLTIYALKTSLSSYQTKITSTNKLDYGLISGTPTIPTNTNQLTNGAGFITSSGSISGNAATATTASKLSTVSKEAWGKTYWTSDGVPTTISGDMRNVGNITPTTNNTYNIGDFGNYFKTGVFNTLNCGSAGNNLWLVGGNAVGTNTGVVIARSGSLTGATEVCRFTEKGMIWAANVIGTIATTGQELQLKYNNSDATSIVLNSTSFKPFISASSNLMLGRYDSLWKGLCLSTDVSVPRTEKGISFCDTNGYAVCKIGANSDGIGIYSVGGLYLKGGCTKGANGTMEVSKTGVVIDEEGNVTVGGNLLVRGGITMYATADEDPAESFFTKEIIIKGYSDGRFSKLSNKGDYMFYTPLDAQWSTGWSVFNAVGDTKLASVCGASGTGGVLDYLYYGGEYNAPWLKLKKTTLEGKYWILNDTNTNPYLKFVHPYNNSTYTWYIQGYKGYLYLGSDSTKSLRVSSDGSIYTPKTLTQGSDIRYKDVHKDLVLSLKEMSDAPSLEFHFMDDESKLTHIGTSAQYWQFVDGVVSEDNEGRLSMDYSSLGVVMGISLAKELSNYESMTDKEIRELKKRIGELEDEIENLKKV